MLRLPGVVRLTRPRPLQYLHRVVRVRGRFPVPLHVAQVFGRFTVMIRSAPETASRSVTSRVDSTVLPGPRVRGGFGRRKRSSGLTEALAPPVDAEEREVRGVPDAFDVVERDDREVEEPDVDDALEVVDALDAAARRVRLVPEVLLAWR